MRLRGGQDAGGRRALRGGDRFDRAATSVQVARQLKKDDSLKVQCTLTKKDRRLLGWAPEKCARLTERADKQRGKLSAENKDRELHMLWRVEELFKVLEPMPDNLKRYMRVEAWTFFQTYAQHESVCNEACCRFTGIRGKGVKSLAAMCVAATLEQLEDGTCTVDVDAEQLRGVLDRNAELEKSASIRTAVCELRLFLDAGNDENEMPPCESGAKTVAEEIATEDEKKRVAEFARILGQPPIFRRQVIEAFFRATFTAWENYYTRPRPGMVHVGYSPAIGIDADRIARPSAYARLAAALI